MNSTESHYLAAVKGVGDFYAELFEMLFLKIGYAEENNQLRYFQKEGLSHQA